MSAIGPSRHDLVHRTCPLLGVSYGNRFRSDWRDARKLYDLAPLLSFVGEQSAKIGGRAGERRGAQLRKSRMRLGIGENRVHRLVDLVDGLAGRAFRRT